MSFWKSRLAERRVKEDSEGRAVGLNDGRREAWKSFICDLDDDEDDGEDELAPKQATAGSHVATTQRAPTGDNDRNVGAAATPFKPALQSLYMQQLVGGTRSRPDEGHVAIPAPTTPETLPPTMPLVEWVAHHAAENREQRSAALGQVIDESYLEKSARVALSLAHKLAEHLDRDHMMEGGITMRKVTVTNTTDGGADFVTVSDASGARLQSGRCASQRPAIAALGRIYYELFTQGLPPPNPEQEEEFTPISPPSDDTDFDTALQIAEEDIPPDEGGEGGHKRKQRRRWQGDDHYSRLRLCGVPPSLSRLVAHMLDNENAATEGLFLPDRAVARLSDVACDLQQMVDDPSSFLHDALLLRWEPILPEKMYGRREELQRCVEVAGALLSQEDQPLSGDRPRQSAIIISGFSGSGKTNLVKELETLLGKKGWRFLRCKFDQEARPQPLSTITSAFDRFLVDIMGRLDLDGQQEVKLSFAQVFSKRDIESLCALIPSLSNWVTTMENDTQPVEPSDRSFNNTDGAKFRLHNLFGLLTKVLSGQTYPCMFVMDDLQFADMASLDLLFSLMDMEEGCVCDDDKSASLQGGGSGVLFVGCYRCNEVAASDPLATRIQQMKDCHTITMTEIRLEGLSGDDANAFVSDSLFYPRRLVLPLSNLIHQKTAGNPLYLREFLMELASENLLTFSLSKHQWNFDEDLIQLKAVSEGVADLLARRLQRLPQDVLSGLELMSCFGSQVSLDLLHRVENVCNNSDVICKLDLAVKELLVKKTNGSYVFMHDAIQEAIYCGIEPQTRMHMLNEIADTLISKTEGGRSDVVLFIIVDLINRVGPANAFGGEDRALLYAHLNFSAGDKSMQTPDFASAYKYVESGISFLGSDNWRRQYDLSLSLFTKSALVCWALGKIDATIERATELLGNARQFEDKIDSLNVLIRMYSHRGDSMDKGFALCFDVLAQLGERFPNSFEDGYIARELTSTHQNLQKLFPNSLDSLPMMQDKQKLQAMKFLGLAMFITFRKKSRYCPIVACRLVQLTISHGLSEYSAVGLASMAFCLSSVMAQRAEGYALGKLARSLNQSSKRSILHEAWAELMIIGLVNIWKEPWQVMLSPLLDSHKILLKAGDVSSSCIFATTYVYRAFAAGSSLTSLSKETVAFLRIMSRYKRVMIFTSLMPVSNTMASLIGMKRQEVDHVEGCEDDEQNLINAIGKSDMATAELIVNQKIIENFIFRRMDVAEKLVTQYAEFFELHESVQPFNTIIRTFYIGLVALHFWRESPQECQHWVSLGKHAIHKFEQWTKECRWNFENKYCLLNAEYHFAMGELEAASKNYHLSISSAKSHRFPHEEAIACELASLFHLKTGEKDLSRYLLKRAVACYQSWGAKQKADALLQEWND